MNVRVFIYRENVFSIVIETLKMTRFIAKIGLQNLPSIALFTNKLHFQTVIFRLFFRIPPHDFRLD